MQTTAIELGFQSCVPSGGRPTASNAWQKLLFRGSPASSVGNKNALALMPVAIWSRASVYSTVSPHCGCLFRIGTLKRAALHRWRQAVLADRHAVGRLLGDDEHLGTDLGVGLLAWLESDDRRARLQRRSTNLFCILSVPEGGGTKRC